MNPKPIEQARTPDLAKSMGALRRAGQRARELAAQTGTALIVFRNGKVVRLDPRAESAEKK